MKNNYEVTVNVRKELGDEVFTKTYKVAIWDKLVSNVNPKEHGLASHVAGMIQQLKLNSTALQKLNVKKFEIYSVLFTGSVGSEIIGTRPALVISPSNMSGEDVTVIPLTSAAKDKLIDTRDFLILKDENNALYQNSWLRLRQICCVSYQKLQKRIGIIKDEKIQTQINDAIVKMFGTST